MRGVYKITNKANGKSYIGRSNSIFTRITHHFCQLRAGEHSKDFQKDFNKYGFDQFTFEILFTGSLDAIKEKEGYFIDHFDSINNGYNSKDESSLFKNIFTPEKKEEFLKKAFSKITKIKKPSVIYLDEQTIDIMLPIFGGDMDLLRADNEILIIPNKFNEFRKLPFIYLNKDLD